MGRLLLKMLVAGGFVLSAFVVVGTPAYGGCLSQRYATADDLRQAEIVAHGSVVDEAQDPAMGLIDTFQIDDLWKGTNFPRTVKYHVRVCEWAAEGVLVLNKQQADDVRASGRINGDYRAYDAWSVESQYPLQWRLTHDPRLYFGLGLLGFFLISVAVTVAGFLAIRRSLRTRHDQAG